MDKTENKLNKIAVFGPHDRFNYGDFLFPLIIDYCFSFFSGKEIRLKKYSLRKCDFTNKGGFKSEGYRALVSHVNSGNHNVIIVSGGECLTATWTRLYSYLDPFYNKFYTKYKMNRIYRNLPKYYLGGKSEYPYSINIDDFKNKVEVYYNAVGGGWNVNANIIKRLKEAELLGVRDQKSYDNLSDHNVVNELIPDSAVMLSRLFPKEILEDYLPFKDEKYIFFQVSNYLINEDEINFVCSNLKEISDKYNLKIIFCPIGTASGHEDHLPLLKMHKKLKNNSKFITDPTIKDIAGYISNSELYIGSSLHGVITSMNYGIPYIGLKKVIKQNEYIKTWSIPELEDSVIDFKNFNSLSLEKINLNHLRQKILDENRANQDIYLSFIKKIYDKTINSYSNI